MIAFQSIPHYQRPPLFGQHDTVRFEQSINAPSVCIDDYNPTMQTLSKRLAEARKAKGWSQDELAKKVGCSQSLIGNLEAERQKESAKIPRIAEALGVNPLWLTEGRGPRESVAQAAKQPQPPAKMVINPDLLWMCVKAVDAHLIGAGKEAPEEVRIRLSAVLYSGYHQKPDVTVDEMKQWLDQWGEIFAREDRG